MLNSAAHALNGHAIALSDLRDTFNSACYAAENAFGSGSVKGCFNDFFTAWFSALDGQAETMGSVADATQQCAVLYDHVERTVLGDIAAIPTPPPAQTSPPPDIFGHRRMPDA
jgi:hypothetical protein